MILIHTKRIETSVCKSRRCGSAYNQNWLISNLGLELATFWYASKYTVKVHNSFRVVAKDVVHSRFFANYGGYFDDDTIETIWIILMSK